MFRTDTTGTPTQIKRIRDISYACEETNSASAKVAFQEGLTLV